MAVVQTIIVIAAVAVEIMLLLTAYQIGKYDGMLEELDRTEEDIERLIRSKYA